MGKQLRTVAIVTVAFVASACTPSIAPGTTFATDPFYTPVTSEKNGTASSENTLDAPSPRTGSGEVHVVLAESAQLPAEFPQHFSQATGFDLIIDTVATVDSDPSTPVDAYLGFDNVDMYHAYSRNLVSPDALEDVASPEGTGLANIPSAIAYARDDMCVMADTQWYAANLLTPPASLAELASADNAGRFLLPDPTTSVEGRSFAYLVGATQKESAAQWVTGARNSGIVVLPRDEALARWSVGDSNAVSAIPSSGAQPLSIAPLSLSARAYTNTGTETLVQPVPGTCIQRPLYLVMSAQPSNVDGVESLAAYLLGKEAQKLFADEGAARPLEGSVLAGTPIEKFAIADSDPVIITDTMVTDSGDQWVKAWK